MNLFSLQNISYEINDKLILNNLNMHIVENKLTCILGKSGAGKTTLLSLLAGRILKGDITGNLKVGINNFDKKRIKRKIAYVKQKDIMSDNLTVFELINLCANLKINTTKGEIKNKVDEIINILDLNECKNVIIGNDMNKGISGGQKKRVAIALELIHDPDIIFLDEPTSGLDTYNAYNVMKILNFLSLKNKTIITILHQPASEIYNLIDYLIVLDNGKCCYSDKQELFIPYLKSLNFNCPIYTNPTDYLFMEILNSEDNVKQMIINNNIEFTPNSICLDCNVTQPKTFLQLSRILFKRRLQEIYRNKRAFKTKIYQSIFLSIIIALIYQGLDTSQESVQNRIGLLFFLSMQIFMSAVYGSIHLFYADKIVFKREYDSQWYTLSSYFLTRCISEIPVSILNSLILSTIIYFAVGLHNTFIRYIIFTAIISFCTLCGNGFGFLIGTIFSRLEIGLAVSPAIIVPILLFSGLFQNINSIPIYLSWIKYISPIQYSFNSLAQNEFTGLEFNCNSTQKDCLYENGEDVLNYLNFNELSISINILIMFVIYCVLMVLSYLFLKRSVLKRAYNPYKGLNTDNHSTKISMV
ncbi:ABC-2 type transporter [seawater metagenome]|uniref:ABC-2 type transporter n=1 Tax=seawater metagenome TaxID=1561972 RepID=A0A5E8CMB2_9ZZZZ